MDGGIPGTNERYTSHHAQDAVYRPFLACLHPPKLIQSLQHVIPKYSSISRDPLSHSATEVNSECNAVNCWLLREASGKYLIIYRRNIY